MLTADTDRAEVRTDLPAYTRAVLGGGEGGGEGVFQIDDSPLTVLLRPSMNQNRESQLIIRTVDRSLVTAFMARFIHSREVLT